MWPVSPSDEHHRASALYDSLAGALFSEVNELSAMHITADIINGIPRPYRSIEGD